MKKILTLSALLFSIFVVSQNDFESSHLYKINNENIEKLKGTWIAVDRIEKLEIYFDDIDRYGTERLLEFIKKQKHIQIKPDKRIKSSGERKYNSGGSYYLNPALSIFTLRVGDFNISKYDSRFDESLDGTAEISLEVSFPDYAAPNFNNDRFEALGVSRQGYLSFSLIEGRAGEQSSIPKYKGDATAYKDRIYWSKDDRGNPIILDNSYRLDVNFCEDCVEYNYTDEQREYFNEVNEYITYKFIDDNTIEINFSNYYQEKYIFSKPYVGETLKNIQLIRVSKNDDFEVDWNSYEDIEFLDEIIFEIDGDYIINTPIPINNYEN
tara:strand:+ start:200 stop:1171 length:972 start_codon:yes stop_codon:yes gene_type:complete